MCSNESCIRFDRNGDKYSNANASEQKQSLHPLRPARSVLIDASPFWYDWPPLPRYTCIHVSPGKMQCARRRKSDHGKCYRMMRFSGGHSLRSLQSHTTKIDKYRKICPLKLIVSGKVLSVFVFAVADLNVRAPFYVRIAHRLTFKLSVRVRRAREHTARKQSVNKRSGIIVIIIAE